MTRLEQYKEAEAAATRIMRDVAEVEAVFPVVGAGIRVRAVAAQAAADLAISLREEGVRD